MKGIRNILMATDLSPASRAGLRTAVDLAADGGASLWIAHAIPRLEGGVRANRVYREMDAFVRSNAEKQVQKMGRDARSRGVRAHALVLRGTPQEAVRAAARRRGADLIVLGTHRRTGLAPLLVGSVARRILATAPAPVLSVGRGRPGAVVGRVLFATDFSRASEPAWRHALDLAARNRARLTIVHVLTPLAEAQGARWAYAELEAEQRAQAARSVDRLVVAARRRGVRADRLVLSGVPHVAIARAARSMRNAWVVVGTHGRTGLEGALLGSVAARLVASAPCPVITVRGPGRRSRK